jgi:hypothetical protein
LFSAIVFICPMASAAAPLLLDLAWAVVTVQLMIITFWCSSEDIRRRLYMPAAPPPPPPVPDDRDASVVLKKRRRLLHPKSVWDTEQVTRAALTALVCCLCSRLSPVVNFLRRCPSHSSVRA